MAVERCVNGHFYDNAKFSECPHCKNELPVNTRMGLNEGKTMFGPSIPDVAAAAMRPQVRIDMGGAPVGPKDEKTVGVFRTQKGYDPVVGWLVCIDGGDKGRDYRLHVGRNFIGRSMKSDIALIDDERISRDDHCSIIFEPKKCVYAIVRGEGEVLVGGLPLGGSQTLTGDEVIEIGASSFVFIPFCKEGRLW